LSPLQAGVVAAGVVAAGVVTAGVVVAGVVTAGVVTAGVVVAGVVVAGVVDAGVVDAGVVAAGVVAAGVVDVGGEVEPSFISPTAPSFLLTFALPKYIEIDNIHNSVINKNNGLHISLNVTFVYIVCLE
jgi:hypothetical protein